MALYTKRGDKGTTSLMDGKVRSKNRRIFYAIGSIDELNSYLGVVFSDSQNPKLNKIINRIQSNLFKINSMLAGAKITFTEREIKLIERDIDRLELLLPVLKKFIIPGGTKTAAELMFARTLVRRVERELVGLKNNNKFNVPDITIKYINRLSDYVFILARWENHRAKSAEILWNNK